MTQIGVGIGVNKSPTKIPIDKQTSKHRKIDSKTGDDEDPQNLLTQSVINTQNSSNSSEQRRCPGGDDDNSNSFESHSDFDLSHSHDNSGYRPPNANEKSSRTKNRRGMSVNWGSSSTTAVNMSSTLTNTNQRPRTNRGPLNAKHASNVKFFATSMAHSLYRNPIRLSGLTSTTKVKGTNNSPNKSSQSNPTVPIVLTSIPSEPELPTCRVYPPPQPRPESLAIMSEELFHERLKARQSPLISTGTTTTTTNVTVPLLTVTNQISTSFPSTSSFLLDKHCIEDVTYSTSLSNNDQHQIVTLTPMESEETIVVKEKEENLIELETEDVQQTEEEEDDTAPVPLSMSKAITQSSAESSDESWRLLNSNSSLDEQIPYIDETDFEDLGKKIN